MVVINPRYEWTALDLTTFKPEDQRRGAGRMLVKWGNTIADALGVKVRSPSLRSKYISQYEDIGRIKAVFFFYYNRLSWNQRIIRGPYMSRRALESIIIWYRFSREMGGEGYTKILVEGLTS